MPPRRSTRSSNAFSNQSTLSFLLASKPGLSSGSHRVSKSGTTSSPQPAKSEAAKKAAEKALQAQAEEAAKRAQDEATTLEEVQPEVQATVEEIIEEVADQADDIEEEEDETDIALAAQIAAAKKMPDKQVKKYWAEHERARKAKRVHQRDLSVDEKVCREFDMSGQYGPSVGLSRIDRWKRAFALDLNPPLEVLSVLLKAEAEEEAQTNEKVPTATGKAKKRDTGGKEKPTMKTGKAAPRSIVENILATRIGAGVEA